MSQEYMGPILPVNKPPRKKTLSGTIVTLVLIALIVVLAVLILRSARKGPQEVPPVQQGAAVLIPTSTPKPQLRPTPAAEGFLPVFYNANTEEKKIAITVQNITSAADVSNLLGLCATYNTRLTFFLTAQEVGKFPGCLGEIVLGGHEIESRGLDGASLLSYGAEGITLVVDGFEESVRSVIGGDYTPHFLRPGGINDCDNALLNRYLIQKGYLGIAYWSVMAPSNPDEIAPGQVLRVDMNTYSLARLTELIKWLNAEGYQAVTMNGLFNYSDNF